MRKILLSFVFLFIAFVSNSQRKLRCGTDEVIKQQMATDPDFARKVKEARKKVNSNQDNGQNKGKPLSIIIPVVVHVVYNTAEENISDQQVQSQIDVLNEDFTASNSDYNKYDAGYKSVKGDLNIRYCLAQVIHKQTNHTAFPLNDAMKFTKKGGSDAIDPMHYLNIWVCDLGDKYLGYAYIPGTTTAERFGVACHYLAFGRGSQYNLFTAYNLGRTVTHEIGHCLGLEHIWGDAVCGNDFVDDTPLHNEPNFGCPGEGHLSTCTGTPKEMWMNYMDYTDDKCMYFFTDGQDARADYFIANDPQLNSIVKSACNTITSNSKANGSEATSTSTRMISNNNFALYPTLTRGELTMTTTNTRNENAELRIYNQTGSLVMSRKIFINEGNSVSNLNVSKLGNGIYFAQLNTGSEKKTAKFILQH